jgi:hypothetical protein
MSPTQSELASAAPGQRELISTPVGQQGLAPIPASIENTEVWPEVAKRVETQTNLPTTITPELITAMVASAVPLLFASDASGNLSPLRGTFTDQVVAQCQRNAGALAGDTPMAAVVKLIGSHMVEGHPVLRVHVAVQVRRASGVDGVDSQFWDLQLGSQVTVGQATCPNCGAPIRPGELICGHCRTDVREVVEVPLVVSRLELY